MVSLTGKSAIVTGGCSGIGYEVVKAFLEQGIKARISIKTMQRNISEILIAFHFAIKRPLPS